MKNSTEITVPVAALTPSPEEGQPAAETPKVGDEVSLDVLGTLKSIDGDTATVTMTQVNAEEIGEEEEEPEDPQAKAKQDTLAQAEEFDRQQE